MPSSLQIQRVNPSKPGTLAGATTGSHKKPQQAAELASLPDMLARYHVHETGPDQCSSVLVQSIDAPLSTVWSMVRRFDNPQGYKNFLKSCHVINGDGKVGSVREVHVVSGLPASFSTERLEILDDDRHVISFSIVGGEHRLSNYRSITTLHTAPSKENKAGETIVVESYIVDVPTGNTKEDTCVFLDKIIGCNLQSLARISEKLAMRSNEQH